MSLFANISVHSRLESFCFYPCPSVFIRGEEVISMIETINLTKYFGTLGAVQAVNLSVQKGEVFGLLGPNGAGKTTTLRMLTTLSPPTSGTARVAGHDVIEQPLAVKNFRRVPFFRLPFLGKQER